MLCQYLFRDNIGYNIFSKIVMFPHFVKKIQHFSSSSFTSGGWQWRCAKLQLSPRQRAATCGVVGMADCSGLRTACSFGLSATSQQYFSFRTNQPPAISQQYFSLRRNQHPPSATSQTNGPEGPTQLQAVRGDVKRPWQARARLSDHR
jgi:hypothetical protein